MYDTSGLSYESGRTPYQLSPGRSSGSGGSSRSGGSRRRSGSSLRSDAPERRSGSGRRQRPQGQRPTRPSGSSPRRPQRSGGLGIPLPIALVALVVAVLMSTFATRCTMRPKIATAEQEAADARAEATALKNEVDRLKQEVKDAESALANAGVDSPWTSTGKFTSGDDTLDKEVKEFCDHTASKDLSPEDAVFKVYTAVAWSEYVERDDAQHPSGSDWRIEYARKYYEHDQSGNCYEFAAFLMYCMRYMGYDDALCQGIEIELQSGGWGDHGIVFVTDKDGSERICDTSRGADGWMLSTGAYNYRIVDFETA